MGFALFPFRAQLPPGAEVGEAGGEGEESEARLEQEEDEVTQANEEEARIEVRRLFEVIAGEVADRLEFGDDELADAFASAAPKRSRHMHVYFGEFSEFIEFAIHMLTDDMPSMLRSDAAVILERVRQLVPLLERATVEGDGA